MNSSELQTVEDLYVQYLNKKIALSVISKKILDEFKIQLLKEENEILSLVEILQGVNLEQESKFIKRYKNDEFKKYFFDASKFILIIEEISKDQRVLFVHKIGLFAIVDLYYDLVILSDFLTIFSKYTKKRVEKNYFYFIFEEAITQKEKKSINDPLKSFEYESSYGKARVLIDNMIEGILVQFPNISSKEKLQNDFLLMISGKSRSIEKLLFPLLLDHLILIDQVESDKTLNTTKMDMLFDLFPIIMPDKVFLTEQQVKEKDSGNNHFYNGSYYEYRVHQVRQLMGI